MKLSYTVFPLSIVLFQNELVLHNSLVLHKSKWKSVFVWDLNLLYCRLYHITITILGLLFQCKTALHTEWLLQCTFLSTHVCSTLTWPVVVESIRCHWVSNFYKPFVHLCIYTSSVLIYCGILKRQRWRKRAGDKPAPANQAGVRLTGPSTLTGQ